MHKGRVTALGYAFVSADYQLLPPATGEDIVMDIQDVFSFLVKIDINDPHCAFKIDPDAMVVAGSSAGGLCAYLAAMHCISPKPKGIVSMYGMGGNFLVSKSKNLIPVFTYHSRLRIIFNQRLRYFFEGGNS